jgi:soluble lytic murein transglycosylase-like protein
MGATAASTSISQMIANAAAKYNVPPQIAMEVAVQESGLNPNAVSSAGAIGVMQLEPATAAQLGVTDPYDAQQNINGGVQYLSQLYNQYGSWDLALAAYNAGPGAVNSAVASSGDDWLSALPTETQNYVPSVLTGAGMNYDTSITASSLTNGLISDDSDDSLAPVDTSSYFWYAALAVGGYIILDWLDII